MPYRKIPLVTGEFYHVFNRSVAKQPIFLTQKDFQRALDVIAFYRYQRPPLRFSHFSRLPQDQKELFLNNLPNTTKKSIQILAFCLMPNHVHFLIKQLEEKGISKFMSNFQLSYSKYFNTKNQRTGALFQEMFKIVRIESDEQFLHVSRYIHLNPVSSFMIKIDSLTNYPWSSFKDYLLGDNAIINSELILKHFRSTEDYKKFVFDQEDYQKKLELVKHLALD